MQLKHLKPLLNPQVKKNRYDLLLLKIRSLKSYDKPDDSPLWCALIGILCIFAGGCSSRGCTGLGSQPHQASRVHGGPCSAAL